MRYTAIGRNMMKIDKYFKIFFKNALKVYDINVAEGLVLLSLYGHNGQTENQILNDLDCNEFSKTQDQLIGELHYDKGVMTRTMQSLEKKNYVLRKDNPKDSRSYIFTLTEKALDFKETLIEILTEWSDCILKNFNEKTLGIIDASLRSMAENAENKVK